MEAEANVSFHRVIGVVPMSDHVYKKIEITGTSASSVEEAVQNAISRAAKTVHSLRWFEVIETRGDIAEGKIQHWQVTVKIGFTLD
jgi:flavin-binding protein dodecin